jgi:uncharacterized damage-inducible protein DinB
VRELRVHLPDGVDPRVGEALWRLGDARQRTLDLLRRVTDEHLDAPPAAGRNTIGTLLYHLAAIELDWLYADILQEEFPKGADDWFPVDVRSDAGDLSDVRESLAKHLDRLAWVRSLLVTRVGALDPAALDELHENEGTQTTPAWVLHHLAQHEAEHRGQIELLLDQ